MSEKDLQQQIEELKQINNDLEKQLSQLIKEKDEGEDDLVTDYQKEITSE